MSRVSGRLRLAATFAVAVLGVTTQGFSAAGARGPERATDQGLQGPDELQAATRAVEALFARADADADGLRDIEMVATVHGEDYWVIGDLNPATPCSPVLFDEASFAGCDAVRFTRTPTSDGAYSYDAHVFGANPLGDQTLGARRAVSTIPEEFDNARTEAPAGCTLASNPTCRPIDVAGVTYPDAYERVSVMFDSPRAPDLVVLQPPGGPDGSYGGHGHLSVLQSRATFLASGRGARRAPLSEPEELAMDIKHTDIAPTVARALGLDPVGAGARALNGDENPAALLRRQDGRALDDMLEPTFNTFAVVVDGLEPELISPDLTPTIWSLTHGGANATRFTGAQGRMITETNANHVSMMTGVPPEEDGLVANNFFNRRVGASRPTDTPALVLAQTLFDAIETQKPWLRTAAVLGKEKLRTLFDCTRVGGECAPTSDNPEAREVEHVRPDYLQGSSTHPDQVVANPEENAPGEGASGSGVTLDQFVMDQVIRLQRAEDPDFTFVNLGQVDAFQHVFGAHSAQGLAAVRNADLQIGRLVASLKQAGKWEHSILMVTADHSFSSLDGEGDTVDAGSARVSNPVAGHVTGSRVILSDALTGLPVKAIVTHGGSASIYLNDADDVAAAAEVAARARSLRDALGRPAVSGAYCRLASESCFGIPAEWKLDTPRVGEVLLTADDQHVFLGSRAEANAALTGQHGGPSALPVPLIIASGGSYVRSGTVPTFVRTASIAPTVAWIYGITAEDGTPFPGTNGWSSPLTEAFAMNPFDAQAAGDIREPLAKRALLVTFDANNNTDVHCLLAQYDDPAEIQKFCGETSAVFSPSLYAVPSLRWLRDRGTLARYGSIAAFPSVTFPNHITLGSGAYPAHHDVVGNRFYVREQERIESPIDPQDPHNPVYFWTESLLSPDVETLHEATHRSLGDWMGPENRDPLQASGAYTAAVDEPTVRGSDFGSLEPDRKAGAEPAFGAHLARPDELAEDTTDECVEADAEAYGVGSALDHLGQSQARALFEDPSHPVPTLTYLNFALVDEAAHAFGPHTQCGLAAYRDSDHRLGRVLDAMRKADVLGETLVIVIGDHSQENQRQLVGGGGFGTAFDTIMSGLDVRYVTADNFVYLRTMRVDSSVAGENTTFTVTDDDTGDPVGEAVVEVLDEDGNVLASGTTPADSGEARTTLPLPRAVSRAGNDAQDRVAHGRPAGDLPTVRDPRYQPSSGTVTLEFDRAEASSVRITHPKFSARTLTL